MKGFIFGDFNPNEDFSTQFGLKVVMGLILALSTPSGCIGLLRIKPQSEAISIEGPAALLSTLSAEHLHLCHQILVISPNETDVIVQIRQKFSKLVSVPILSYKWSAMSNPPPETILRQTPAADNISKDLVNDYCVAYFFLASKNLVQKAIKDIPQYNWFPGSARYLVFFLNEDLSPEELKSLSVEGGRIVHIVFVTKIDAKNAPSSKKLRKTKPATYLVTKICQFCHDGNEDLMPVGKWVPGDGLHINLPILAKMSKDFQGHVFKGVTLKFPPYITYEKGPDKKLVPGDSLDIRIMNTIASFYNFTFQLVEPFDQQWGYQLENGSFTGVIGTVSRREADFSMNLLITAERESASDFTMGYLDDPLTFAIASPKPLPQWRSLIRPYNGEVWIFFLLCLLLAGPIYWIALLSSRNSHMKSLLNSCFEIFGLMVSQSRNCESTNGIRILVGFWILFSLVVTKSYVGNLVAHLMVPALSPTINTLEELVKSNFKWGIADFGASNYQLFKTSKVPLYQTIFRGMDLCPSTQECLARSAGEQYAFISWRNNMRESIEEYFKDKNGKPLIHLARQDFFPSDIGFALQMGSSLKDPFDYVILHLLEAGLVPKWLTDIIEKGASKKASANAKDEDVNNSNKSPEETSKSLALHHLQGIFIVYGVGLILSFVVFVVEFLTSKMFPTKF